MTTVQTLDIRKSEIRQKLNELSAKETLEDGEAAEIETLRSELSEKETQWRAALAVAGEEEARAQGLFEGETSEGREYRELRSKVGLNRYIEAATEKRAVDGAEAELQRGAENRRAQIPA